MVIMKLALKLQIMNLNLIVHLPIARNGIRVVKTGYVNDGVQNIKRKDENGRFIKNGIMDNIEHCRKVLETAAKYNSLVVHEPIKDTGIRRTFSHYVV